MRATSSAALRSLLAVCLAAAWVVPPAGGDAGSDEYAVYSALITQHYGKSVHNPVVIDETTISGTDGFVMNDSFTDMLARALSPLPAEAIFSYKDSSARPGLLAPRFATEVPWRIVTQAALDTIFSQCPRGWDLLSERFPGCRGYVTLSNIGWSPTADEALVYTEDHCGLLCGEGTFVYLKNEEGTWRVVKKLTLWVE